MASAPTSTAAPQAPLRVTRLVESNFGRIISADISPGRKSLIVLRGPNEAGKTSTLNGLIACLAGKGAAPDMPVHAGAEHASVSVELSDALRTRYRITKSYKAGKEWLNVQTIGEDGEAEKTAAPQTLLDSLVSDLSFDPLAFAKVACSNRQQDRDAAARMLFAAIGRADVPEKAKAKKTAIAEDRRQLNVQVKQIQAELAAAPDPCPGQTLQAVTDADLKAQMDQAEAHNNSRRALQTSIERCDSRIASYRQDIASIDAQIAALQAKREAAFRDADAENACKEQTRAKLDAMSSAISTDQITAGLAQVREHNAKAAQQQAHRIKAAQLKDLAAKSEALTATLSAVDLRVEEILATSDLGQAVPGITYIDSELRHNGVPFSQASGMRRLELSALIGMAANPALRILTVDEGDQLDDASLARLIELAKARDYAVWMTAIRAGNETDPDTHLVPVSNGQAHSMAREQAAAAIVGATHTAALAAFDPNEL